MATTQLTEGTQLIDEVESSIPSKSPGIETAALVPSSVASSLPSEVDEDFGMQRLALSDGPPQEMSQVLGKTAPSNSLPLAYTLVDFETQRTDTEQAQVPIHSSVTSITESNFEAKKKIAGPDFDGETPVVACECDVAADAEDYSICLCEGPCKRWVHLWSVFQ